MFLFRLPLLLFSLAYQSAFLALGQIWANKVRAILTTIGIVIGVASVTAVIAALTGLKTSVLNEFESIGTNKIFISPNWVARNRRFSWREYIFQPQQFEGLLEHCPSVRDFTRMNEITRTISHATRSETDVQVMGIDPSWHLIENRSVIVGRPFSLVDNEQAKAVCLINGKLQDKLMLPRDPTGESVMVGDRRFTVVGVVETRTESSMFRERGSSGGEVFIPFTTARQSNPWRFQVIAISRSPDVSEEAQAEIKFFLRRTRHVPPGSTDTFQVEAVQQFLDKFKSVATAITLVAGGIVGISLLVGGVGIMNIMLVSVSERTREIGLRKAVGARPSAILLQFLIEAMVLCLVGGLIGLVFGQIITRILASIPDAKLDKAAIPAWAVLLSLGFSAGVGLIFGMFPAIKAARLDPIEALRHE
jgi:putative ABC transport system permease protein